MSTVFHGPERNFLSGDRVKTHPSTDAFMQGARYGTVVCVTGSKLVVVRLEISATPLKQLRQFHPDNLAHTSEV